MSEVEKLYKKAKVKPVCDGLDCFTCTAKCNNGKYPEFTAEKQLSLIKWLANSEGISIRYQEGKYIIYDAYSGTLYFDTLEEALAQFVNLLWQDLTESEQEQIGVFLKG